jgi:polyhydroxyalkanoate synthase subunit PhaC
MFEKLKKSVGVIQQANNLEVGCTPKAIVWTLNKATLYRYAPICDKALYRYAPICDKDKRHKIPLLLVYSLVNRPYIFDLRPGRSFIEYLVERGFDVFLLDWGTPGIEDKDTGIDEYVLEYLPRAVRAVKRASGQEKLFMMGYCIGAVQALLYAALDRGDSLQGLIMLTAPVDFSVKGKGIFAHWLTAENLDIDRLVRMTGNIPPEMVEISAKMLRPVDNYVGTYSALADKIEDDAAIEGWQALYKWIHDGVPFTGEAFRQWVVYFVRENRLLNGTLALRGRPVELSQITAPVLNVVAAQDHIVPPAQSMSYLEQLGSPDKETFQVQAGHVGLVIGRSAKQGLWPKVEAWLLTHNG